MIELVFSDAVFQMRTNKALEGSKILAMSIPILYESYHEERDYEPPFY